MYVLCMVFSFSQEFKISTSHLHLHMGALHPHMGTLHPHMGALHINTPISLVLGIPHRLHSIAPPCGVHQAIGDNKLVLLMASPTKAVSVVLVLMAPRMLLPGHKVRSARDYTCACECSLYTYTCSCIHMCIHTYILHVHMDTSKCTYTCRYVRTCIHTYIHTCSCDIHTFTHMYITCTHTQPCMQHIHVTYTYVCTSCTTRNVML